MRRAHPHAVYGAARRQVTPLLLAALATAVSLAQVGVALRAFRASGVLAALAAAVSDAVQRVSRRGLGAIQRLTALAAAVRLAVVCARLLVTPSARIALQRRLTAYTRTHKSASYFCACTTPKCADARYLR
jgi:hypothetical protein